MTTTKTFAQHHAEGKTAEAECQEARNWARTQGERMGDRRLARADFVPVSAGVRVIDPIDDRGARTFATIEKAQAALLGGWRP